MAALLTAGISLFVLIFHVADPRYGLSSSEYAAFYHHFPISKFYPDLYHRYTGFSRSLFEGMPRLLDLFDWHIRVKGMPEEDRSFFDRRPGADPRTVLSGLDEAFAVIQAGRNWDPRRKDRVLVFMGMSGLTWAGLGETDAVRLAVVGRLQKLFARAYTVGNDAPVWFRTMPLGLVEHKVRFPGLARASAAIAAARLDEAAKPNVALAAFGLLSANGDSHHGPLMSFAASSWTSTPLAIESYRKLPYYDAVPSHVPRRSHMAGQVPKVVSRAMAAKWLATPAAKAAGVRSGMVPHERWWPELACHRFLLSPMGDEVQSPKSAEALLVLTVPVVQRGPYRVNDDLLRYGFPIVVIDEWEEVTAANLSSWWRQLSPRLASFRANCLTAEAFWRMAVDDGGPCH